MHTLRLIVVALTLPILAACATQKSAVNLSVGQHPERPLPHKVLLVQPDILVHEISTGEVAEKVDEWSKQASDHAASALAQASSSRGLFEVVEPGPMSPEDKATLEDYSALYALVAGSAHTAQASPYSAWRERAAEFDYTVGPGLQEFADRNHVDAAVFLVGTDYISTAGRKAAMGVGIAMAVLTGIYAGPVSIPSFMSVGVVDMRSGDLIWYSTDVRSGGQDLRDQALMKQIVDTLLKTYPSASKSADAKK